MKKLFFLIALILIFVFSATFSPVAAQVPPTTYGTLDNFDVVNDTGSETHGFEIELEGISVADVPYFFGAPYERYGDPEIVANSSSTGVIVRYKATYEIATGWSAGTPTVASMPPTDGHSCWSLGDPNYPKVGCDHFGISLNAQPTKTTYRWLVENPGAPGTLMTYGTNVPLPVPVWNVTPPAIPGVDQPIAEAVITPLASSDPNKCGDAQWVKVYTTELPSALQAEDLNHMVVDDPNVDIVPEPSEVEFEWMLLQSCPGKSGELIFGSVQVGAGNEAVSRRFEFYTYTGQYDPDPEAIREARCDNPLAVDQQIPERCGDPVDGVAGVGGYIGKQNAAVNLAGVFDAVPVNSHPVAVNDAGYTPTEDTVLTMPVPGVLGNDSDAEGSPLTAVLITGPAHGTMTLNSNGSFGYLPYSNYSGPDSFTYVADDGIDISTTATVTLTVIPVNDPPVADDQTVTTAEDVPASITLSASDVEGDLLTYAVGNPTHGTLTGIAPNLTYTPVGNYNGPDSFLFTANDGSVDSLVGTVNVTVSPVNDPPVAYAGPDQADIDFHSTVVLDGSGSSDVDGDTLLYQWTLVTVPAHSKAVLTGETSAHPTFYADKEGTYTATLIVNDGSADSSPSTVTVTVVKLKKK